MKKITLILSVFLLLSSFTVITFAYEKPEIGMGWYDTEGGANEFQMYFDYKKEEWYAIYDIILGPGVIFNLSEQKKWDWFEEHGMDRERLEITYEFPELLTDAEHKVMREYYEWLAERRKIPSVLEYTIDTGVRKEQFIEANKQLDEANKYTDEEIEILFGDDYDAILRYYKHPYAYLYEGEVYCFYELLQLDYAKQYEMNKNGELLEFLNGFKSGEALLPDDKIDADSREMEWINYVTAMLESGVVPDNAPATGDGAFALIALAVASAGVAAMLKKRRAA